MSPSFVCVCLSLCALSLPLSSSLHHLLTLPSPSLSLSLSLCSGGGIGAREGARQGRMGQLVVDAGGRLGSSVQQPRATRRAPPAPATGHANKTKVAMPVRTLLSAAACTACPPVCSRRLPIADESAMLCARTDEEFFPPLLRHVHAAASQASSTTAPLLSEGMLHVGLPHD